MRPYIKLFLSFAYIGTVSFGGGYSMLPMFQRELVDKNGWLTEMEMADMFSVGQCLPGVIACNTAVFVGYKQKGVRGGIVSAFGAAFPSVVITLILAAIITNLADFPVVMRAFAGLRVGVSVLILNSVIKLWKQAIVDLAAIVIFAVVFLIAIFTSFPVAILVIVAGFIGIAVSSMRKGASE
ncbi:MAG: chromate transporter [Oscillospiraceae bacterium]|nr:chromate transporter [Oscillospiraceae bacterium]